MVEYVRPAEEELPWIQLRRIELGELSKYPFAAVVPYPKKETKKPRMFAEALLTLTKLEEKNAEGKAFDHSELERLYHLSKSAMQTLSKPGLGDGGSLDHMILARGRRLLLSHFDIESDTLKQAIESTKIITVDHLRSTAYLKLLQKGVQELKYDSFEDLENECSKRLSELEQRINKGITVEKVYLSPEEKAIKERVVRNIRKRWGLEVAKWFELVTIKV